MEWIIYTILAVVILAAAVVCVCVFAKTRRDFSRNDVHINGVRIFRPAEYREIKIILKE